MAVKYDGLLKLLKEKQISKTKLGSDVGISSATLAKFAKNQPVSMIAINKICNYLNCSPNDIISFEPDFIASTLLQSLIEEKAAKVKGGIYHETQVAMTYNSNHIEGSKLSLDQTRYIFETNTIGAEDNLSINVDDVVETINHFRCIDYILAHVFDRINENIIKELHKILKSGTSDSLLNRFNVGEYKSRPNAVGGRMTTPPGGVAKAMQTLIFGYESNEKIDFRDIIDFHHQFESIHPFQDGNGRVGRLIAFKECLKYGFVPFIIDEEIKMFYYRGLKEWENQPGYLLDTCLAAQDKYKVILNDFHIRY
jgi:DNA-binding Xre family transcriptional regulator